MTGGMIEGGWQFVQAAYSLSAAVFVGYTLSVLLRYRAERGRREREAAREKRTGI